MPPSGVSNWEVYVVEELKDMGCRKGKNCEFVVSA